MKVNESVESARARGLQCSDAAPKVEGLTEVGQVPVGKSGPPKRLLRDGSPDDEIVRAEHQREILRKLEETRKTNSRSVADHAASASSAVVGNHNKPDGNIYERR
jgi:hypothetical protein